MAAHIDVLVVIKLSDGISWDGFSRSYEIVALLDRFQHVKGYNILLQSSKPNVLDRYCCQLSPCTRTELLFEVITRMKEVKHA